MSHPEIKESELLEFVAAIETGEIVLSPEQEPQDIYAGDVAYVASNGWKIVIFNDANEWDYIDNVSSADGRFIDFDEIDQMPALRRYNPSDSVAWDCYRIPGYMKFRCIDCSKKIKKRSAGTKDFRCSECIENNLGQK